MSRCLPVRPAVVGQRQDEGAARQPARRRPLLGALLVTFFVACAPRVAPAVERVAICYGAVSSWLIPLAKRQDFYSAEGVEVELLAFPSGKQALAAMFAGQCALAAAAETPVVHASLTRNDFSIVAAIAENNDFERIVVRSDRGIRNAGDLRGRRVVVPEFTTAHYFLDIFLATHGIAPSEVIKIYVPAEDVAQVFRRGEVDAAAYWEPNIQMLATEFGVKARTFSVPGLHVGPFLLLGGRDYLRQNRANVERVLRALIRAEGFAKAQPEKTMTIMMGINAVGRNEVKLVWSANDFRVALDQSLLFTLENVARWAIALRPPAQRPAMPNYLDFIDLDGLLAVKPAAVTIIH